MRSYNVKQISEMLSASEETVRRWIRDGKLGAVRASKKSGNVISSSALNEFIRQVPKYGKKMVAAVESSSVAMSALIGGLLGGLLILSDNKKKTVTPADIESFIKKQIAKHEKNLETRKARLADIQAEIEAEQQELAKYQYAIEHFDMKMMADNINKERNGEKAHAANEEK